jgi:DNA-binding NtrC family response regulator
MEAGQLAGVARCGKLLSKNPTMLELFRRVPALAGTDVPVLIEGESGTGKEVLAWAIHEASAARRPGPFVSLNCCAVPENLLEHQLFGHVRSGFARPERECRPGAFEKAKGGTLFLDIVECLPPRIHAEVVRVLRERRLVRVGDNREVEVDVRVIASTISLDALARQESLRPGLLYRLDFLRFRIPPLRERVEDIPLLARHFASTHSVSLGPEAMEALSVFEWPGNVRQLQYTIERACILAGRGPILPEHLALP